MPDRERKIREREGGRERERRRGVGRILGWDKFESGQVRSGKRSVR